MERHPYFDLRLHTNFELESYLDARIVERQTMHEWPLSCVQLLVLADGQRWIYKTSSGPTVEAEFYARARSRLLIQGKAIHQDGRYTCMLFEYLDAPRLCDRKIGKTEAQIIGQALQKEINQVKGAYPVYMDVASWINWQMQMGEMLKNLDSLVSRQKFRVVTTGTIKELERTASSDSIKSVIEGPSGLVHLDLTDDNIFLPQDGYRVIDWQRPIRGPLGLDLAIFAEALGFDPVQWAGRGITQIVALLHIHWFTACAARWFPPGCETYDRQIAGLCEALL